jgi:hypothetical protein
MRHGSFLTDQKVQKNYFKRKIKPQSYMCGRKIETAYVK